MSSTRHGARATVLLLTLGGCVIGAPPPAANQASAPPAAPPPASTAQAAAPAFAQPTPQPHLVHPRLPPAPEVQAPMVQVGRLRVPQHADLNRVITHNGRTMTLREAVLQADPNATRTLRSSRAITLQQTVDALDVWEKTANTRLASVAARAPLPLPTQQRLAATHQQLAADQVQRRQLAASGWRSIIMRPAGSPRSYVPSAARLPNGQPLVAPPPPPGNGPPTLNAAVVRLPHPATTPYDDVWPRSWGDVAAIAADLTSSAGNEFEYDVHQAAGGGCAGEMTLGAWLLGRRAEIARLYAGAHASAQQVNGRVALYLLGQAQPIWHRDGKESLTFLKMERPLLTASMEADVATVEPVTIHASLAAAGTAMFQTEIKPRQNAGRDFGCDVVFTPEAKATVTGTGSARPMAGVNELLSAVVGDMSAGIEARVTLFDLKLPSGLGFDLRTDPHGWPVAFDEHVTSEFKATLLAGELLAFLEIDFQDSLVGWLFDIKPKRWEWPLHEWDGDSKDIELAQIRNSIPFVQ